MTEEEIRENKIALWKSIEPNYELCPFCEEAILVDEYKRHNDFECPMCFKWIRI